MTIKTVETALKRAYQLGQIYWQQADSEYASQNKKADVTEQNFRSLVIETLASIEQEPAVEPAPVEPIEWKHDCAALLTNDVVLWIPACPHCGKPRTVPSKPAPVECEPVAWQRRTKHDDNTCTPGWEDWQQCTLEKYNEINSYRSKYYDTRVLYAAPQPAIDAEAKRLALDICDHVLSHTHPWAFIDEAKKLKQLLGAE